MRYCEEAVKEEENCSLILKFLTELCLAHDPLAISDASVSVAPSKAFTLNFDLLMDRAELPRRMLRSSVRPHPLEDLGLVSLLRKRVESGLCVLEVSMAGGVALHVDILEELWCALVCLQHARYKISDSPPQPPPPPSSKKIILSLGQFPFFVQACIGEDSGTCGAAV